MNIALPPYLLLIPFAIVFVVAAFFSLVDISHLLRYGARNGVGFLATFLYVSGFAIVVFITLQYLPNIAWTEPVNLFSVPSVSL